MNKKQLIVDWIIRDKVRDSLGEANFKKLEQYLPVSIPKQTPFLDKKIPI